MEDEVVQGLHDEEVGGPDSTNLFRAMPRICGFYDPA